MRDLVVIGLRSATIEEIKTLAIEWQKKGYKVKHLRFYKSGLPLPHNGVLRCTTK